MAPPTAVDLRRNSILVFTILKKPTLYERSISTDFRDFGNLEAEMWHCVEERQDNIENYGRIRRKIIFGDIFRNRENLLQGRIATFKVCYFHSCKELLFFRNVTYILHILQLVETDLVFLNFYDNTIKVLLIPYKIYLINF